nr:cytochrome b [Meloidogyne exigua]
MKFNGVDFILNYFFNFGSLLFMIFFFQIFSGILLSFFYSSEDINSFVSVQYLMFEVNYGWLIRLIHFNLVSMFFFFLFFHMLKAMFFFSYRLWKVWFIGLLIFFFLMMESFLGYTLIWSQMSFWAATVITSLLSVFPIFGNILIIFLWCGFFLNSFSLKLFFFLHFMLPILIFLLIFFHVFFLHDYGSSVKLNNSNSLTKRSFYPFYWIKDLLNFFFFFIFFIFMLNFPFSFNESLSFMVINNLVSPIHIVPEWYFLWVYAILRSLTIKWMGVFMMIFSIFIFFFMKITLLNYNLLQNFIVNFFIFNLIMLTWLGCQEAIYPFVNLSFFFMLIYFFLLILINM